MTKARSASALLVLSACADTSLVSPPEGASLLFEATARGSIVYECVGVEGHVWQARSVKEAFFDEHGRQIAERQTRGWRAIDGSTVKVESIGREPSKRAGNIDSRLWAVRSHEGDGIFDSVETVRRVRGKGGEPVSFLCSDWGAQSRLDYTAHYQFYGVGRYP